MKRIVDFPLDKDMFYSGDKSSWDNKEWDSHDAIRNSSDRQRYYIIPSDAKIEGL